MDAAFVSKARSFWGLVVARAQATPQGLAAIDPQDREMSFAELKTRAERAAAGLQALGVGRGSVVAWQLPNWLESLVLMAALARLGAIQNPLVPILRERELDFILRQSRAELLITPNFWRNFDYGAMAKSLATRLEGLKLLSVELALPEGDPARLPPLLEEPDDVRWYYYTSGTTADPKGAQHTDQTLIASGAGIGRALKVTPEDRAPMLAPVTHIGGAVCTIASLLTGCAMVYADIFDKLATAEQLKRQRITLAGSGTPYFVAYLTLLREQPERAPLFPEVRAFMSGGAPKSPGLYKDVRRELGAPITSSYGLTEAPMVTFARIDDTDEERAHSEGKVANDEVDIRLVTMEGVAAAQGEEGEVRIKAPQLMKGYLSEELNADAFDAEGYFRTGDLGRFDARGNLTITGRLKDIIIRNMENISALEVENALYSHPLIAEAAAIGLPDAKTGERVCAVVVPKDAARPPSLEDISGHLLGLGLSKLKLPEQLEIVAVLPRNAMGKTLKAELRTLIMGRSS